MIRALVFDWGNTLMQVFPQYAGAMVDWPEVAAVPGANVALHALSGRFRLVVATNAADSSAEQVQAALDRVGLGQYIEAVYTMHELGARKPQTAFFFALEQALGLGRDQIAMVGDEFLADVMGATRAGWQAIWLNPRGQAAPALLPVQAADLSTLAELPEVLTRPFVPGLDLCRSWLQEQGSLGVMQHVELVAALAYWLALELRRQGVKVDPLLAQRGGLLHDLCKLKGKGQSGADDHGRRAALWLHAQGLFELAEIADRHMLFGVNQLERAPRSWEEKLVYFCDKLVEGNRVVSFEERLEALRARYNLDVEQLGRVQQYLADLRSELCSRLEIPEAQLVSQLRAAVLSAQP
jgi:putative hydrolase of the HAD superfamily